MEALEALRQKILGDVVPLIIDGADSGSDKFSLILRLIQSGNADQAMYQKAYDSAAAIEDSSERLEAMMSLLDEIEIELDQPAEGAAEEEAQEGESQTNESSESNDQQDSENQDQDQSGDQGQNENDQQQ